MPYIGNQPYQGVIDSGNILNGSIDTVDLKDGSVTSAKLETIGGLTAGSYTTANITVDSKGRVTLASNGSGGVSSITGTADQITASASTGAITLSLPQSINTTSSPSFANITLTGEIRGPSTLIIDPTTVGDDTGIVRIRGDLQVDGTTTTINSTTLEVADLNITLAKNAANAAAATGAGITVAGASATLIYAAATDTWNVNKNILITPGTGNGILYLNANKVATTGSALTFDGTNLSTSGYYIGTAATGRLAKSNTTGRNVFTGGTTGGTTDGAYIITEGYDYGGTAAGGAINLVTAGASSPITFLINGSEAMRLISTGLGIGLGGSSPTAKLHVTGTSGGGYQTSNKIILQRTDATLPTGSIEFQGSGGHTNPYWNILTDADVGNDFGVSYNGSKFLQILSNGNVGIGTTSPDAGAKLTVAGGILTTSNFSATTGSTAGIDYLSGNLRFFAIGTSGSTKGGYQWIAKGADNSQLTQMTLDASGNLLVGHTSSTSSLNQTAKLQVSGGIRTTTGFTSSISVGTITQNTTTTVSIPNSGLWILTNGSNNTALLMITIAGGSIGCQLIFSTNSTDMVAGTTTEPAGGNYLRVWMSSSTLNIKNINAYTGPYYLTPIATF